MQIKVIYGTETGNAEMVAEDIVDALSADFDVEGYDMSNYSPANLCSDTLYFIVCSTYGDGDLPNSAQPFFDQLQQEKPDLVGVRFAVFGLGDSFYETYNKGSQTITNALVGLGATQIGDVGLHDAANGDLPGDIALPWAKNILGSL